MNTGNNADQPQPAGANLPLPDSTDSPFHGLSPRNTVIFSLLLLWFAGFFAFFPALDNEFTNWDDQEYVTSNPIVKNLSLSNLKLLFTSFQLAFYHPLTLLSFSVEYSLVGPDPVLFHANNLLLHLLNTSLAFLLLRRLSGRILPSLLAGLLFAMHPLRVESVAWITGRKDLLAAFFFLSALLVYSSRLPRLSFRRSGGGLILAICGFLSKPTLLCLPFILLLIDYASDRRLSRQVFLEKIPFFLLSLVAGIIAILAQQDYGSVSQSLPVWNLRSLLLSVHAFVFYWSKIFWPVELALAYPFPQFPPGMIPLWLIGSGFLAAAYVGALLWAWKKNRRDLVFGGTFFLLAILPNLQLVPVAGVMAFDRYTYLPGLGAFYLLAVLFLDLYQRLSGRFLFRLVFATTLAVAFLALSLQTRERCEVWKTSSGLYEEHLKTFPDMAPILMNRALTLLDEGRYEEARADLQRYLKLPEARKLSLAHMSLGIALGQLRNLSEAEAEFQKALGIPGCNHVDILTARGRVYRFHERAEQAVKDFSEAIRLNPQGPELWLNRAMAWELLGQNTQAIQDYSEALHRNPAIMDALKNRGILYQQQGSSTQALSDFQEALRLAPNHAPNWFNLGLWKAGQKQWEEAADCFRQALNIDPSLFPALSVRAECLMILRRHSLALTELQEARKRWGDAPAILLPLFYLHRNQQNATEARQLAQILLIASPSAAVARELEEALR